MQAPAPLPDHAASLSAALSAPSSLQEQVERWLAFRGLAPGEWIELQALDVEEGSGSYTATRCAYAADAATLARLYQEGDRFRCPGVYTIANRIDDAVASRQAPGRWFTAKKGRSTTDRDVTHRRVIFVDVDYERPTGTAATDQQVEEAHAVAARIYADLAALTPPGALAFGHSGNGRSIFIALACLAATADLAAMVKGILAALKERHETAAVKIDPSVSDEKRLAPAFGTVKRKGNGQGERPHRRTVLVTPPAPRPLTLAEVGDLLAALRRGLGVDATARVDKAMGVRPVQSAPARPGPAAHGDAYRAIFQEAKDLPVGEVLAWLGLLQGSDPVCPGCGKSGDSSVAVYLNGLKCLHKSCADKGVGGSPGFRTVIDIVCEAQGVSASEAVNALAERFGTPALPEPREPAPAKVYHLPTPAPRPPPALLTPPEMAGDLAALLSQLAALPPEQRAAAAMSPSLVQAAASLPDTSPEFAQLRVDVKAAGAAMGAWDKAVKAARPPPPSKPAQAAAHSPHAPPPDPAGPDAWRALLTEERGEIKQSYGNLVLVLRESPAYKGRLSYNEMRLTPCLDGQPLGDADVGILREQLERSFGLEMSADNIKQAVRQVAEEQRFHPVRAYLSGLVWDGTTRIDDVARLILGILPPPENEDADPPPPPKPGDPPTPYMLAVRMLRAWFTSAVARAMRPGCKVDTALVLIGPQGFLKSTFFSVLGGPFFSDTAMDISGKDGLMQLHSAWIYEWGEIENVTTKKHSAEVKGFITSPSDNFRAPYASAITINKRSGVIVGSTNENQFLNDPTGSRRFHILRITSRVNVPLLKEWRDQLWAEARALFEADYQWWLADEEDAVREQEAAGYRIEDATTDAIRHWLGSEQAKILLTTNKYILAADVLQNVMKLDPGRWGRPEQTRVGLAMAELGWVKDRPTVGKSRVWVYRPPS